MSHQFDSGSQTSSWMRVIAKRITHQMLHLRKHLLLFYHSALKTHWITAIYPQLSMQYRDIIDPQKLHDGGWLTESIINAGMRIIETTFVISLTTQFPSRLSRVAMPRPFRPLSLCHLTSIGQWFLQITNTGGNHWVF